MTTPALAITVDWDGDDDHTDAYSDITADTVSVNLRQALDERGVATIIVHNETGKFTPDNSGGVLYGNLKPGRRLWIRATWSAVTYALFYGTIRRIALHPEDMTATLIAEDMTSEWDMADANVALSASRSIRDFRGALLDLVDSTAARRSLAYGMETSIPGVTGADGSSGSVLSYLSQLDEATGSLSYVLPSTSSTTLYQYVTIDRASLEAVAAVETWDAETDAGAITGLTNYDVDDDSIVNSQSVTAAASHLGEWARLWTSDLIPFTVPAGETYSFWAAYDEPASGAVVVSTATNSPTVTLTPFFATGLITVVAGVSASLVTDLGVEGRPSVEVSSTASTTNATSAAAPPTGYGQRRGSPISSPWLASHSMAAGLSLYIVWRHSDPKVRPDISRRNVFPSILQRFPGDVVAFTAGRVAAADKRLLLKSRDLTIESASGTWEVRYTTEELPAAISLFTVGGSAAQGVGGSGILGY